VLGYTITTIEYLLEIKQTGGKDSLIMSPINLNAFNDENFNPDLHKLYLRKI